MNLKRYDDIMDKAKCEKIGEVIKKENGKWSWKIRTHVLPMDDVHVEDGPEFDSAIEAASSLFKVYGLEDWYK